MSESMPGQPVPNVSQDDKVLAALSYLWVLVLIPLLKPGGSEFVKFHSRQGFLLFLAELVLMAINIVPFLGWIISFLGGLVAIVFSVMGLLAALSGRRWEIPYLNEYAKKLNF
jgi:uncharacterized membrane protein